MATAPPPLRVAVDATSLLGPRTGVGRVAAELVAGLAGRDDLAVQAFAVTRRGRSELAAEVAALAPGTPVGVPPVPARLARALWVRGDRPRIDGALLGRWATPDGRPNVVLGPNFVVPPARAARVVTVHDLTCIRFPAMCTPDVLAYPGLVARAVAGGAWVHTPSEAVAGEVRAAFAVDPGRVVAVPNGVGPATGDPARGRDRAGGADYVLAVGTVEPRKDLATVVRAADLLAGEGPEGARVVHVGGDGWASADFEAAVADLAHPGAFVRLGRVDDAALADLYAGARVVVQASVYEGFGLPVLEAMAAGVPVVATDVPALAEVAGDAALLVPVGDHDALAGALARAWTDEAWRAGARERGRARVAAHPWSATVAGVADLLHRAAGA